VRSVVGETRRERTPVEQRHLGERALRFGNFDVVDAGCPQPDAARDELGPNEEQVGVLARGHAIAARVDDHPTAVAGQTPRLYDS
jgi:hypothetical protein